MKERKECSEGCAGVFAAPVAMPTLVAIFIEHNQLDRLEDFVSKYGAQFYGLDLNEDIIGILQENWDVPFEYGGVVPYKAVTTLSWKVL